MILTAILDRTDTVRGMFADVVNATVAAEYMGERVAGTRVYMDGRNHVRVADTAVAILRLVAVDVPAWNVPDGAWTIMDADSKIIGWADDRAVADVAALHAGHRATRAQCMIENGVVMTRGDYMSTGFRVAVWDVWAGGRVIGSFPSFTRAVVEVIMDRECPVTIATRGNRYIATMIDDWDGAEINLDRAIVSNYAG